MSEFGMAVTNVVRQVLARRDSDVFKAIYETTFPVKYYTEKNGRKH